MKQNDTKMLEQIWITFSRNLGDNDLSVEHTGIRLRQKVETLERDVKYDKAKDYLAPACSDEEKHLCFCYFAPP